MGKQRVPQLLGEAHGGLGGKVLRSDRAQQADQAQRHQHRHIQHQQPQHIESFQQLKQWPQDAFLAVVLQIRE